MAKYPQYKLKTHKYLLCVIRDELMALKDLIFEQKLLVSILVGGLFSIAYVIGHISTKEIVLAADQKTSSWYQMAENAKKYVEKTGFSYTVRTSEGTLENAELLNDPTSGVNVAFLIPGALSPELNKKFYSLGSLDYEPIWIFYKKTLGHISSIKELSNYRVGVGPTQSGRYALTEKIFFLNNVKIKNNAHFVPGLLGRQIEDFQSGKLDALIFIGQAFDKNARLLAEDPSVELYDFTEAEAYAKNIPFFQKVSIPAGSFNIAKNIPNKSLSLIAISTTLAVRKDTHPSIQLAILMASKDAERATENLFFAKRNEFPAYIDPLIEISPVAQRFYDYGPPALLNYLPFWAATLVDRFSVLFLTILAILYPLGALNMHLRKIRFGIKKSGLYAELVALNRRLENQNISLTELEELNEKLANINQNLASYRIPTGEESDYFSFAKSIQSLQAEIEIMINDKNQELQK